jgi:hypothetical protein
MAKELHRHPSSAVDAVDLIRQRYRWDCDQGHGPMNHHPDENGPEDERDRRVTNIFLVVFFLLVVAAGLWLVEAMVSQRDIDNCVAQGRRNCVPIDTPRR